MGEARSAKPARSDASCRPDGSPWMARLGVLGATDLAPGMACATFMYNVGDISVDFRAPNIGDKFLYFGRRFGSEAAYGPGDQQVY